MKLIEKYKIVQKREMLDCRMKSLKELLRSMDIELSSYEVLVLCGGITFNYGKADFKKYEINNVPYALVSEDKVEEKLLHILNVDYIKEKIDASEQGWNRIKELLDHEIPVLFKYDGSVFSRTKRSKVNIQYLSLLLLVGYDDETREVAVVLTNTNELDTYQKIPYEEFQKYRGSQCIPYSPDYECVYIKDKKLKTMTKEEINSCLLRGIYSICNKMLYGQSIEGVHSDLFECNNFEVGIKAMKKMKRDIRSMLPGSFPWNRKQVKLVKFSMLFLRDNILHGSTTGYRKEFAKAIIIIGDYYSSKEVKDIGEEFIKISKGWSDFLLYMGRCAHNDKKMFLELLKMYVVFSWIIRKEERAFKKLNKVVSLLG